MHIIPPLAYELMNYYYKLYIIPPLHDPVNKFVCAVCVYILKKEREKMTC